MESNRHRKNHLHLKFLPEKRLDKKYRKEKAAKENRR